MTEPKDVTAPDIVEIEIRDDGKVVWVHVNGITAFRACRIGSLHITDHRPMGTVCKNTWPSGGDS